MRILYSVIHFDLLTGASMQVYELARALARRGHQVSVTAPDVGGELTRRAVEGGIAVHRVDEIPEDCEPDLLHLNQAGLFTSLLRRYPTAPAIATIHSAGQMDRPLPSDRIAFHACVRPEVRDAVVRQFGLPRERALVIYNGVDLDRFRAVAGKPPRARRLVLFVGTVGPLRRQAALDLIERGQRAGFDVRFVGMRADDYLDRVPPHVSYHQGEVWEIEREVSQAHEVAGVFLGRTTVEGWAAGKPAWIYDIDMSGRVLGVERRPPPPPSLLRLFDIEHAADLHERLYEAVLGRATAPPLDAVAPPPGRPR
jgi:hypothetical protein